MKAYAKALDSINNVLVVVITVLFGLMSFVSLLQVIFRYVLKMPLPWSEELARFLFVWVVFLGCSVAVKAKAHVGLEYFVEKLSLKKKNTVYAIAYILCILMCIIVGISGATVVKATAGQVSPAMELSMAYIYIAIPVGFFISALNFLYNLICLYINK